MWLPLQRAIWPHQLPQDSEANLGYPRQSEWMCLYSETNLSWYTKQTQSLKENRRWIRPRNLLKTDDYCQWTSRSRCCRRFWSWNCEETAKVSLHMKSFETLVLMIQQCRNYKNPALVDVIERLNTHELLVEEKREMYGSSSRRIYALKAIVWFFIRRRSFLWLFYWPWLAWQRPFIACEEVRPIQKRRLLQVEFKGWLQ